MEFIICFAVVLACLCITWGSLVLKSSWKAGYLAEQKLRVEAEQALKAARHQQSVAEHAIGRRDLQICLLQTRIHALESRAYRLALQGDALGNAA